MKEQLEALLKKWEDELEEAIRDADNASRISNDYTIGFCEGWSSQLNSCISDLKKIIQQTQQESI